VSSIQRTLGLRLALAALVLLLGAAGALYVGVRWLLIEQFDGTLRAKLSSFATLIEQEGEYIELGFVEVGMPEYAAQRDPEYAQIRLSGGNNDGWVVFRSPSLGEQDLPRLGGTEEAPVFRAIALPDGRAGRAIGAVFPVHSYDAGEEGRGRATVDVVLARGTAELARGLAWLAGGMLAGIAVVLGAGFWLGRSALARGLRPLDELAMHVGAIRDPARAEPFVAARVPDELRPLVESHDRMLARVRAAFERERRTAANIAHELRTPIAELVLLAETAQRHGDDPNEQEHRLAELRVIGGQIKGLIATLLELARLESGQVPLELEPIDLGDMVAACWSPLESAAEAKGQRFRMSAGSAPCVQADRLALGILLSNLLRNAVDHAPVGDEIHCELRNGASDACFVLSNAANGFQPADLERLSEPFWRASQAREDRAHAGLGLSLAQRFAELLGVALSFDIESGRFHARVRFPEDASAYRSRGR